MLWAVNVISINFVLMHTDKRRATSRKFWIFIVELIIGTVALAAGTADFQTFTYYIGTITAIYKGSNVAEKTFSQEAKKSIVVPQVEESEGE